MTDLFLLTALVIFISVISLWLLSILLKDVSIVDVFWGSGFVLISWLAYWQSSSEVRGLWLLPALVTVWGVRLSLHIAYKKRGEGEDKRYVKMREKRGESFWWRSLYIVFLLQGALMWVISLPLQTGIYAAQFSLNSWHAVGALIWCVGFLFEALGDAQLLRFKAKPENKGKVLDRGLWRYTRHPNYFGDSLQWWGFYLVSVTFAGQYWTILSPILMSLLLMFVSGVAMTEATLKEEKPEYEEYLRRTNAFFPGPVKDAT